MTLEFHPVAVAESQWLDVRSRIQAAVSALDDVRVMVFEPHESPTQHSANRSVKIPYCD